MSKSKIKAYVVGGGFHNARWISRDVICAPTLAMADVVVLPGGGDWNPKLYGEKPHRRTFFIDQVDESQIFGFEAAVELGKPIVGICRGAQLACIKAGGKLIQDQLQSNYHSIDTVAGPLIVSSLHHQAQYPWMIPDDDWDLIGWSFSKSAFHHDADLNELVNDKAPANNKEVEIVFYKKINALAIQSHPEMQEFHNPETSFCRKLVEAQLKNKL